MAIRRARFHGEFDEGDVLRAKRFWAGGQAASPNSSIYLTKRGTEGVSQQYVYIPTATITMPYLRR
jgi:hypothetical protein